MFGEHTQLKKAIYSFALFATSAPVMIVLLLLLQASQHRKVELNGHGDYESSGPQPRQHWQLRDH